MYISRIEIENIRSISSLRISFPSHPDNPNYNLSAGADVDAGWHVLIGDNGAGKSTVLRAIALALIGPTEAMGLRADWKDWLGTKSDTGFIKLNVKWSEGYDKRQKHKFQNMSEIPNYLHFNRNDDDKEVELSVQETTYCNPYEYNWGKGDGWFSVAYGTFRRLTGGNTEWAKVFYTHPKLGAHLSIFGEDIALTESLDWLKQLKFKSLEKNAEAIDTLEYLKTFVNKSGLLPDKAQLVDISSAGVLFKDGNDKKMDVTQLSDGFRSLLSLMFELIRQLIRTYTAEVVFSNVKKEEMNILVPGVVLIDEVDVHLHPSWQTRIGTWFIQYFPNIQFIVTTHSPLICRACEKGSIWRLAAPGSKEQSGEITGVDKDKLVFGNVLDAYGTEVFGQSPVRRSEKSNGKLKRLGKLNMLSAFGKITEEEEKERLNLQQIFQTDAPID